jgi:hypothetical protein
VKQSEVKQSEVDYIWGRGSSDYVATSYRLDGPGSFLRSILVFSVCFFFFIFSNGFFMYYVFLHVFSVSCVL